MLVEAIRPLREELERLQERITSLLLALDQSPTTQLSREEYRNETLRESIRKALRRTGNEGLRARDVIRELEDGGFEVLTGSTPLPRRIHTELHRMEDVVKTENGRYVCTG